MDLFRIVNEAYNHILGKKNTLKQLYLKLFNKNPEF